MPVGETNVHGHAVARDADAVPVVPEVRSAVVVGWVVQGVRNGVRFLRPRARPGAVDEDRRAGEAFRRRLPEAIRAAGLSAGNQAAVVATRMKAQAIPVERIAASQVLGV